MKAQKIFTHLNQIFCPVDKGHALRGVEMLEAKILENGYIAILDGRILDVGEGKPPKAMIGELTEQIDCRGKIASPGLIDSHTHLVYGGSRENEFAKKLNGVSYLDILREGGGILSTVHATRESSFEELYEKSEKLLEEIVVHGVTTVEAKSGYGLNWEVEKRQLEVVKRLNENLAVDLVSTFMGAHAVPPEFKGRSKEYIDVLVEEMLPKVVEENLAEFCDVFCEKDVFSAEESRRILSAAKELGLKLKIHADEIEAIGGTELAAELHAISAEHLMVVSEEEIKKMSEENVIGNLLPATTFSLMTNTYAPAKKMLEAGMAIALSSDSNPGSCPTANLQFIMQLGCFAMKLTPIQVFNAVTINAAYAIDRAKEVGSFDIGKYADITMFDAPNIDYPLYFFATNLVSDVYKKGELIVKNRQLV
ncbi:MAG: imidazolonepropionase [Lactobacillales bacterium]|nr:imidazolonepropionase [Lactobacillales bacterium]